MKTSTSPNTAPLPQLAADALHRLADAGLPVGPSVMAAEYRKAEARANKLIAVGRAGHMSDLAADDLAHYIDLVNIDSMAGDLFLESDEDVARYRAIFDNLVAVALSPRKSVSFVAEMNGD